MPVKYCPHCAAANSYSINPPEKCGKCHDSFASAFKEVVASKPAKKVRMIYVDEDGNEVDAPETVQRVVVRTKPKVKTGGLKDLLHKKRLSKQTTAAETDDEDSEAELPEEDDGGLSTLDPQELAASLDPDAMVKNVNYGHANDDHVKLGDLANIQKMAADARQARNA